MELWVSIALGMVVADTVKELAYELRSRWYTYKHRNDKPSTLDRLLFGTKFEEEELLEK